MSQLPADGHHCLIAWTPCLTVTLCVSVLDIKITIQHFSISYCSVLSRVRREDGYQFVCRVQRKVRDTFSLA